MRWTWLLLAGCAAAPERASVDDTDTDTDGTSEVPVEETGSPGAPDLYYTPDEAGMRAFFDDACVSCHGVGGGASAIPFPAALEADLRDEAGWLVVPGDPAASRLWRVVSGELATADLGVMPESGLLAPEYTGHVALWIEAGAPWTLPTEDLDSDGFAAPADCDDGDPAVHPDADELCNGVDDDCDGTVDEDDALDASPWYPDLDGDGFGDDAAAPVTACDAPVDHVAGAGDCDDGDAAYNPDATETCADPADYNCDGSSGADDLDGDGFGACHECDDADPYRFPGAPEDCNGIDDDCDGAVDEDGCALSHAADIQPIWDAACVSCHGGFVPSGGLSLEPDAWARIVGVPSGDVPAMDLIAPFDPAGSYLWHKLQGTQLTVGGTGGAMPKSGSLSAAELATIESWILQGAPP